MAKPKCPDCKRDGTYNAKFDQCSACGRGYERTGPPPVALPLKPVSEPREKLTQDFERHAGGRTEALVIPGREYWGDLEPGKPCPACGKPVGKSKAQLQKEYRERKKK